MMLFAIGMLSGYGAEQVTRWLDEHVRRLFRVSGEPTVKSVTTVAKRPETPTS